MEKTIILTIVAFAGITLYILYKCRQKLIEYKNENHYLNWFKYVDSSYLYENKMYFVIAKKYSNHFPVVAVMQNDMWFDIDNLDFENGEVGKKIDSLDISYYLPCPNTKRL